MIAGHRHAGAVEMDLDGLAMGRAGRTSKAGDVSLDPQSLVDRFNRIKRQRKDKP